jgi:hypothetical protein
VHEPTSRPVVAVMEGGCGFGGIAGPHHVRRSRGAEPGQQVSQSSRVQGAEGRLVEAELDGVPPRGGEVEVGPGHDDAGAVAHQHAQADPAQECTDPEVHTLHHDPAPVPAQQDVGDACEAVSREVDDLCVEDVASEQELTVLQPRPFPADRGTRRLLGQVHHAPRRIHREVGARDQARPPSGHTHEQPVEGRVRGPEHDGHVRNLTHPPASPGKDTPPNEPGEQGDRIGTTGRPHARAHAPIPSTPARCRQGRKAPSR